MQTVLESYEELCRAHRAEQDRKREERTRIEQELAELSRKCGFHVRKKDRR